MLAKLKAIWSALKYLILTTKDWLAGKSYSFTISALHLVYVGLACVLALGAAYRLGKWDGSVHGLKQMAYGFVQPAADPPKEQIAADLDRCTKVAHAWQDRAVELEQSVKQDKSTVKVAANLPVLAPANCVAGKTVYVRVAPRSTTVMQDLGLAK